MRAHAEALRDARPTATTVLAGVLRRDGHRVRTGARGLVLRRGAKLPPADIRDGFAEAVVPYQVGDLQIFTIDRVIGPDERQRRLVVIIAPVPLHVLMVIGQEFPGLLAALAPLLAVGEPFLRFSQPLLCAAIVARVLDGLPCCRDEKHLEAHINSRLFSRGWHGLGRWGHQGTRDADIPPVRLAGDSNRLDGP